MYEFKFSNDNVSRVRQKDSKSVGHWIYLKSVSKSMYQAKKNFKF